MWSVVFCGIPERFSGSFRDALCVMYLFIVLVIDLPSLTCAFVVQDFCASLQCHEFNVVMTSLAFFFACACTELVFSSFTM